MSKPYVFWLLCAFVLLALSGVYLQNGFQKRNSIFACWLCVGVVAQLVAYWGDRLGRPWWFAPAGQFFSDLSFWMCAAVLFFAMTRWRDPINQTILRGLGAMLILNLLARHLGGELAPALRVTLRNVAFFGPTMWMLMVFSGARIDRLPLWAGIRSPDLTGGLGFRVQVAEGLARGAIAAARSVLS